MDSELVRLQEWNELIGHSQFHKLIDHLEGRIKQLEGEAKRLSEDITLDNSIKLSVVQGKINEIRSILFGFKVKKEELIKLKRRQ